ncbi:MAG TPA: C39 family peptidase [Anaerolineales bacterium]|nr:C39 family peptidase [Anaerolineales bacterium]
MSNLRHMIEAASIAALLLLMGPGGAAAANSGCPPTDPECLPAPPGSVEINPYPEMGASELVGVDPAGAFVPVEAVIPMPLARVDVEATNTSSVPAFPSLAVPLRHQDPSDVSCGVQALGMALSALPGAAPASPALLGFLQGNGMMYEFGTGVEELAFAAQSFGYRGSTSFHGGDIGMLAAELEAQRPVVVSLGANGEGQPGHFVTVTGISPDGQWISYNDPTLGDVTITASEFMRRWGLQGYSGVLVATEPPAAAPDPMPWVALTAAVMALISTSPLGLLRKGIGGRLEEGAGSGPRKATSSPPKPAPKSASKPKPRPKPAAPRGAIKAEAAFEADPPPAPPTPVPPGVAKAEEEFEATGTPAPPTMLTSRFDEEGPAVGLSSSTPTPIVTQTPRPGGSLTTTPTPPAPATPSPSGSGGSPGTWISGYPSLPGGNTVRVEEGTFVGKNPFSTGPSYGPRADIPGPIGVILKAVGLANALLRPYAYGEYLNSEEPNVSARLSYSQSPDGTLLQSLLVENQSGQAIKVSVDVARTGGIGYNSSPTWLLDGSSILYSGEPDEGGDQMSGLGLLGSDEPATVSVAVVASFNDPPLLRDIRIYVPSSNEADDAD